MIWNQGVAKLVSFLGFFQGFFQGLFVLLEININILDLRRELNDALNNFSRTDHSNKRHQVENDGLGNSENALDEQDPDITQRKYHQWIDLQGLCINNLNNDFEHQCFADAIRFLGARTLISIPGDLGNYVLDLPGAPDIRFLPHQIWGIGFVVERFMQKDSLGLRGVLIADDMGLGKTYTALGAVFHIKWLLQCAKNDKVIPFYQQKLTDLKFECPLLVHDIEILHRPIIVVVPASLTATWAVAIERFLPKSGLQLRLIDKNYKPTAREINHGSGMFIYLVSYHTLRSRYDKSLKGCQFSIGIFDESHSVKNPKSVGYHSVMSLDAPFRIQLTGTPMHHNINDWVVQMQ